MKVIIEGHHYLVPLTSHYHEFIFQNGVVPEVGRNGVQNEEVLEILIDRMNYLNKKFPCRENALAITKLEEALMWLNKRTENRVARGVEGKHEA